MLTKNETWFDQIPGGRSRNAMRVGRFTFVLAVVLVPFLFYAFLELFSDESIWFACLGSATWCGLWLLSADAVRKFTNGERLLNIMKSTDVSISTIGNFREDSLARWATLIFALLVLLLIGGLALFVAHVA